VNVNVEMTKKKIVVVGAGGMGSNHSRAIATGANTELSAVVDFDTDKAKSLAKRYESKAFSSLDEALASNNVDGVVVATTTASHLSIAREVIERGIPLLVEKPITDDLNTTRELLELSKNQNVPIMCGFVERFNPAVRTALGLMDEPMKHFMSVRHSPVNPRATASVVYDLLIHDIDIALAFHGRVDNVSSIDAVNWTPKNAAVDEISDCVMKFEDGSIASLSASRQGQRKIRDVRVVTDTHLFEVDLLRVNVTIYKNVMQEVVESGGTSSYRAETIIDMPFVRHEGEPLALQMQHFSRLISGEVDPDTERETLLLPHQIAETVIRSSN
jgi:predicted dehydrogenase